VAFPLGATYEWLTARLRTESFVMRNIIEYLYGVDEHFALQLPLPEDFAHCSLNKNSKAS
jgi:hypothetical protein